jgi:hypothetical protein
MAAGNRVRYIDHKYKKNHKISLKAFTSKSTGAKYRTILNLEDMEFYIRNERSKEYVFKSGTYTNLNVLKRNARAKLENFGIELKRESRDRNFGLCSKGTTQKQLDKFQFNNDEEI